MDTALIKGSAKVSTAYLNNYLGIKPGTVFNESILRKVSTRLKENPFLTEARSFEIEFTKDRARPVLYLQEKKATDYFKNALWLVVAVAIPVMIHLPKLYVESRFNTETMRGGTSEIVKEGANSTFIE